MTIYLDGGMEPAKKYVYTFLLTDIEHKYTSILFKYINFHRSAVKTAVSFVPLLNILFF